MPADNHPHSSLLQSIARTLAQRWCALRGHDLLYHSDDGRLYLECASCGFETPGWDLKKKEKEPPSKFIDHGERDKDGRLLTATERWPNGAPT